MSRESILRDLRYIQQKIAVIMKELETGPENSREEVAPMGRNTTRDWSMARLAAVIVACIAVAGCSLPNCGADVKPPCQQSW